MQRPLDASPQLERQAKQERVSDTGEDEQRKRVMRSFLRETASAGKLDELRYQRRFMRVLRDLKFTLSDQSGRLDNLAMDRKPYEPPSNKLYAQVATQLFISRAVVPPLEEAPGVLGPAKILEIMVAAEQAGFSYESDERAEALCLAGCLIAAGLERTPGVRVSSDVPEVIRRDETLQHFLIICWYLVHAQDIVSDLSARIRKIPRLRTNIGKALVPSLIRAAYRVRASPTSPTETDRERSVRELVTTNFLDQVESVVRYLWDSNGDRPLLEEDAMLNQLQYGSYMRESLPPVRSMLLLLKHFTASLKRTRSADSLEPVDALLAALGSLTPQGISTTQNLVFAAVFSGDGASDQLVAPAPADKKTLREGFVEDMRRDRGVGGAIVSARVAIIEALLDLYMVLTVPRAVAFTETGAAAPEERLGGGTPQKSARGRSTPQAQRPPPATSPSFKPVLLQAVRDQLIAILALVESTAVGRAPTNTDAGYVSAHTSAVLLLAPVFAHFLAMSVALGFYADQQQTLRYFPFDYAEAEDTSNYGFMGDLQLSVLQSVSSWMGVMMQLTATEQDLNLADELTGGKKPLAVVVRSNVLHFLANTLTRKAVLAQTRHLQNPLASPLSDVPVALSQANDYHQLMVAKRVLRVVLRAFVGTAASENEFSARVVQLLNRTSGFLDVQLVSPPDDVRHSLQISFGLGHLEEYEGVRARRIAFNRWSAILDKGLNDAAVAKGGLSQGSVTATLLRLCATGGLSADDQTRLILRNIYAAVGILDILRDQPAAIADAVQAAHRWSLLEQERFMEEFVEAADAEATAESGGRSGFSLYGSVTVGELVQGLPQTQLQQQANISAEESFDSRDDSEEDEGQLRPPPGQAPNVAHYPTKDDAILTKLVGAVLAGVANGTVDPAWVRSVLSVGLSEMLSDSDSLQPADMSATSGDHLVRAVVDDIAGVIQAAATAAPAPTAPEPPTAPAQSTAPPLQRYEKLAVLVHLVPEKDLLDPETGLWIAYEILAGEHPQSQDPGLLIVGRVAVPDQKPARMGEQENYRSYGRRLVTRAIIDGVAGALKAIPDTVEISASTANVVILPYVDRRLVGSGDVDGTESLFTNLSIEVPVADDRVITLTVTRMSDVFLPVLRGPADAAAVIACFVRDPTLIRYLREAAMRLLSVLAGRAANQGIPVSNARITSDHYHLLVRWALYLFATVEIDALPKRQDGQLVRAVDRDSIDSETERLVSFTQVLILQDLPVFWLRQMISDLHAHPSYKPTAIIVSYTDTKQFIDSVVAHRCVRMEVQLNLLREAVATGLITVVVHPKLLIELLGVRPDTSVA
jgi:hypothetical protein